MSTDDYKYDVFLSHAGEDDAFVKRLADNLERAGVTVFEDARSVKPGEHITVAVNNALKASRKLVFVISQHSVSKKWPSAEALYITYFDPQGEERRLIPIRLDASEPPELIRPLKAIDFRNDEDYSIRYRELVEALDLVTPAYEALKREDDLAFEERRVRGRKAYEHGKAFEHEIATLYKLHGFEVRDSRKIEGVQIDLTIHQRRGLSIDAAVECKDLRVTAKERDQIIAANATVKQKHPSWRMLVVSSKGFADDSRSALEGQGVECKTYSDLLWELVPLENYVHGLVQDYEEAYNDLEKGWGGRDLFIRPWLVKDSTNEQVRALDLFAEWLSERTKTTSSYSAISVPARPL